MGSYVGSYRRRTPAIVHEHETAEIADLTVVYERQRDATDCCVKVGPRVSSVGQPTEMAGSDQGLRETEMAGAGVGLGGFGVRRGFVVM